MGEYGASATDVIAETLWLSPDGANDNMPFGGDDGVGGYAPLAVSSAPTGGTAQLLWVHGSHMGVPLTYTSTTGAEVTPPVFTQNAFPGQMRTLTDLYYNRYRDYDPSTGRYIQADPIGLNGDPNPYAYAMNNPLRYSDPMGLAAGGQAAGNAICGPICGAIASAIEDAMNKPQDPCEVRPDKRRVCREIYAIIDREVSIIQQREREQAAGALGLPERGRPNRYGSVQTHLKSIRQRVNALADAVKIAKLNSCLDYNKDANRILIQYC